MTELQFKLASVKHAEQAADLFLDGKVLQRAEAIQLFTDEFSICESHPDQRVYVIAEFSNRLVGYGGARFYDQAKDENMYQTSKSLPTGWYLRGLKVHREFRRSGIARKITIRRLSWLKDRTSLVFVFLNDENKETIPMYQDFGFETVSKGWEFLSYEHKRIDQRGILLRLGNIND